VRFIKSKMKRIIILLFIGSLIYALIAQIFSHLPRPLARCFGWLAPLQSVAVMPDTKEALSPQG